MEKLSNKLFQNNKISTESLKNFLGGVYQSFSNCQTPTNNQANANYCPDLHQVTKDDSGKVTSDTLTVYYSFN